MRQRPLSIVFLVLAAVIFILRSFGLCLWQSPDLSDDLKDRIRSGERFTVYGTVTSRNGKTDTYSYILSESVLVDSFNNSYSIQNIQLSIPKTEPEIKIDSKIKPAGKVSLFENASNPGGFNAADYYAADSCYLRMYAEDYVLLTEPAFSFGEQMCCLREMMHEKICENTEPEAAAVLCALLLGEKGSLEEDTRLDYSAAGLSHILSISGLHISLFGMALYNILLKLHAGITPSAAASAAAVFLYCAFIGGGESTVRAAITFTVMLGAKCLKKSYDSVSAVSLAGTVLLLIRPMSLFRAGFQLSFSAALGAGTLYPVFCRRVIGSGKAETLSEKVRNYILRTVLLWTSVNLLTLIPVLYNYHRFSLYSLISNMIFVPLTGFVLGTGAAGMLISFVMPFWGSLVLFMPSVVIWAQKLFGEAVHALPFAFIVTGQPKVLQMALSAVGIIAFMIMLGMGAGLKKCFAVLCVSVLVLSPLPEGFYMTVVDVGQGDCIVIHTDAADTYIVDGGSSSQKENARYIIEPYLSAKGITRIEALILTHADGDHMNGFESLIMRKLEGKNDIEIKYLLLPVNLKGDEGAEDLKTLAQKAGIRIMYLKQGDTVKSGNTELKVLFPGDESGSGDSVSGDDASEDFFSPDQYSGNAGSLVMSVEYEGFSALLTGDIEGEGEEYVTGIAGHYDCLKTAHHGSRKSTSDEFLDKVSPEFCIISAPKYSMYGHPHEETLERIEAHGSKWYQTGLCGAVTVRVRNGKAVIETYK